MKTNKKRLSIEKLVIARISNPNVIRGGFFDIISIYIECLTKRPSDSVNGDNCESQECAYE